MADCSINHIEALKKDTVHMKDRSHVDKILSQLVKGGAAQLQVISDFDQTLTRVHKDGVKCATTYGIIEQSPFITEDYRYQTSLLFNHYHPIENDPNLSKTEKIPHMIEWYTKSMNLMPDSGISEDKLVEMVELSNVCLRDGCTSVFECLQEHNVPLLIFSAGIGDVLIKVLERQKLLLPNMKIIANFMQFDEKKKLVGFKGDMIHTFNKNQSSIENCDYFDTLKCRSNIILFGDSLGDLEMSEGAENVNAILKIGFLNHRIEENLAEYLNSYDIVLTDDQTMDIATGLLKSIL